MNTVSFFCPVVLSFSVWFLYRLLRFHFRFPAFLGGGFCYSVISSRRYTPPRATWEPEVCVFPLRAVFFLALLMLTYLFFFFVLFLPFFDFDLDSVCFHPVFFFWVLCCLLGFGFCCVSFGTWYVYWYARTLMSPFYFCLRYTICLLYTSDAADE